MCKVIGKSKERILCKLSKSEILQLYLITRVAMETTKKSNFTCQSKSFSSIFFTCQVSACELQPFFCHDLANDVHSQTTKTVFSHLNNTCDVAPRSLSSPPAFSSNCGNCASNFSLDPIGILTGQSWRIWRPRTMISALALDSLNQRFSFMCGIHVDYLHPTLTIR